MFLSRVRRFAIAKVCAALMALAATIGECGDETIASTVLTRRLHHLRIDGPREWSEFPETPEADHLERKFSSKRNESEQTLVLRQQDVKQAWRIRLNGKEVGRLTVDENDMIVAFPLAAGLLVDGDNVLRIEQDPRRRDTDDIRVGEITIHPRPMEKVFSEASLEIDVLDQGTDKQLPARVTIINRDGALQTVGARSNDSLAVRPGIVYTANGTARFGLPVGRYTIFAGRGFEYSLDSATVEITAGEHQRKTLRIRREVPTEGWVACDTHVHTRTFSGHGDATIDERMITLAGEGVELPIATDHNRHIDYEPFARTLGVQRHFTPVAGNEVTTAVGHFNVFPARADAPAPDHRPTDWKSIFHNIQATPDVKIVILNHARDLHAGTRPFGPKLQNTATGENLEGWQLRANAMEVINSGSVQSDALQLFRDWMTQLNHGRFLTPVGGSDSHDVGRHFVGQGRTYVRARDIDAGDISIDEALQSLRAGRVMVSYGLLAELTVDGRYGPGELAPALGETIRADVRVLGPHWVRANRILLFANGQLIRESTIAEEPDAPRPTTGVIWTGGWDLPRPKHDIHLVAIALGPGVDGLYWKTAKPYQPTSPDWKPQVIGASGAVWLDIDGDGRPTPAIDYARAVMASKPADLSALLTRLAEYDEAVAIQAARLSEQAGHVLPGTEAAAAFKEAAPTVRRGIQAYLDARRESEIARLK